MYIYNDVVVIKTKLYNETNKKYTCKIKKNAVKINHLIEGSCILFILNNYKSLSLFIKHIKKVHWAVFLDSYSF